MTRQKIAKFLDIVFGWGIYICLILGGLAFFGFLIGIIMGGGKDSAAQSLAVFIQKQYFPVLIKAASISIGLGLISMYFKKEEALSLKSDKKEAEEELKAIKAEEKVAEK